jgi:high-affinity iron transporter
MGTLLFQVQAVNVIAGAVLGTVLSAFVASLWSRYGHRVNLALFFQVTAVFLLVFVVQLVVVGVHEMAEAYVRIPFAEWVHVTTEPYGPDGQYGRYLTYMLVLLPIGWLAGSTLFARRDLPQAGRIPTVVN